MATCYGNNGMASVKKSIKFCLQSVGIHFAKLFYGAAYGVKQLPHDWCSRQTRQ